MNSIMKTRKNDNQDWGRRIPMTVFFVCMFLFTFVTSSWGDARRDTLINIIYEISEGSATAQIVGVVDKSWTEMYMVESIDYHYVTSIADGSFAGCDKLESFSLSKFVTSLGDRCFADCSSLKSFQVTQYVESIGKECFKGCTSLSSVEIRSEKMEGLPEGCFNDCTSLQQMIIRIKNPPAAILSESGLDQFAGASPLTSLYVPKESVDAYRESSLWSQWETIIATDFAAMDNYEEKALRKLSDGRFVENNAEHGNSHYYSLDHENLTASFLSVRPKQTGKGEWYESLFYVTIPEYVLYDHKIYTVKALGDGCFRDCVYLKEVNIPSTVTEFGKNCFTFSMPSAALTLPEGVTTLGNGCFLESYISKIDLPASLTSLGSRCFAESINLSSVILRSGDISTVSMGCFESCNRLSEFVCYANQVPMLEYDGDNSPFYGTMASEGKLYVQKDLVEAYKATPGWNEWKEILPIDAYGSTNGIATVEGEKKADAVIYDLQGRRVQTPQKNGLYIKNGKKFVVH